MTCTIARTSPTAPSPGRAWRSSFCALLLGLVCALLPPPSAAAPIIDVDGPLEQLEISGVLDVLADPQRNFTVDDVSSAPLRHRFLPVRRGDLTLDFNAGAYWLRFAIHNHNDEPLTPILKILPADLTQSDLYKAYENRPLARLDTKTMVRQLRTYPLHLPANSTTHFFLKLDGNRPQGVSLNLYSVQQLLLEHRNAVFFNGAAVGALLFLMLFNCFAGLAYRDDLFLWLALYSALVLGAGVTAWGIGPALIGGLPLPSSAGFSALALLCLAVMATYGLRFSICRGPRRALCTAALKALIVLDLVAALCAVPLGAEAARLLMFVLLPLTTVGVTLLALQSFISTHEHMLLYYVITRLWYLGLLATGSILHGQGQLDSEVANIILLGGTGVEALLLTGLQVLRTNRQRTMAARHRQHVAVVEAEGRARSELLARLNPPLRTQLSGMLGMAETLQNTVLSVSQRDYTNTLQRAAQEMLHLLDNATQEATRDNSAPPAHLLFDLHELLRGSALAFQSIARDSGVSLRCDIAPDLPEAAIGDPARLRQLVQQLVNTAFESPGHGDIHLRASRAGAGVEIELRHGGEVPATTIAEGEPAPPLRFAIIGKLVQDMRGEFQVQRLEGGARLRLRLPLIFSETDGIEPAAASLSGKRLLIVDGDDTFSRALQHQAESWGMTVLLAHSGQQALAMVRNQRLLHAPIDMLLIDHDASDGRDLHFAARIRRECIERGLAPPAAILLTDGHGDLADGRLREAGVSRVLTKPASTYELRRAFLEELNAAATETSVA